FDQDEAVLVQRGEVADQCVREGFVDVVLPLLSRVPSLPSIELVDDAAPTIGVVPRRFLQGWIESLSILAHRHPLEAAARRLCPRARVREERILWRLHVRQRNWRLEHFPRRVRVEQEWAELVAEPEVAVAIDALRLDVEIGAGEQTVGAE